MFLAEKTEAQTELNGIDARIQRGKPSIRNMHVAYFRADVVPATQEVEAQGAASREIDARCAFWHLCIGKESAAADFEIGDDAGVRVQRPFEGERVYANAVGGVRFLNDQEYRNGVHRVFQAAAEGTWSVWRGEDQPVAESYVPNAVAGLAAIDPVAAAGPHL